MALITARRVRSKRGDPLGALNRQRRFETLGAAQERRVAVTGFEEAPLREQLKKAG